VNPIFLNVIKYLIIIKRTCILNDYLLYLFTNLFIYLNKYKYKLKKKYNSKNAERMENEPNPLIYDIDIKKGTKE
jgi:hypothetical protein